jgi:hypothetical protein
MKRCSKCKEIKEMIAFSKDRKRSDGHQPHCKECNKRYVESNKERVYETNRASRAKNIDSRKQSEKQWYLLNKNKKLASNSAGKKKRRANDELFVLKENISSRINKAFRGLTKSKRTLEMLGCSLEEAKLHIESLFQPGMSWDNYGYSTWHIDHKIPLASATNIEELEKLCHISNLQPLWAMDNIHKSDKYARQS